MAAVLDSVLDSGIKGQAYVPEIKKIIKMYFLNIYY